MDIGPIRTHEMGQHHTANCSTWNPTIKKMAALVVSGRVEGDDAPGCRIAMEIRMRLPSLFAMDPATRSGTGGALCRAKGQVK
jgi:hypothetical protein